MASAAAVAKILGPGVDEDVVEWVAGALADGGYDSAREFAEGICGMLEAAGLADDLEAALPIAERLWGAGGESAPAPVPAPAPTRATRRTARAPAPRGAAGGRAGAKAPRVPAPRGAGTDLSGLAGQLAKRGIGARPSPATESAEDPAGTEPAEKGEGGAKLLAAPLSLGDQKHARADLQSVLMSSGTTEYKTQNKAIEWTEKDIARVKKVRLPAFRRRFLLAPHPCSCCAVADSRPGSAAPSGEAAQRCS